MEDELIAQIVRTPEGKMVIIVGDTDDAIEMDAATYLDGLREVASTLTGQQQMIVGIAAKLVEQMLLSAD